MPRRNISKLVTAEMPKVALTSEGYTWRGTVLRRIDRGLRSFIAEPVMADMKMPVTTSTYFGAAVRAVSD